MGKDVAEILGYTNSRKALLDHVDNEDKKDGVTIRDSIGRDQGLVFINDAALYSLHLSWGDWKLPCPDPRHGPVPANLKNYMC